MDVVSVRATMEYAVEWARSGKGPIIVEIKTYRYSGHSMSDPGKIYRPEGEVKSVRSEQDCIANIRKKVLDLEWATVAELKQVDKDVRKETADAIAFAKSETELAPETMFEDIYVGDKAGFVRSPDY